MPVAMEARPTYTHILCITVHGGEVFEAKVTLPTDRQQAIAQVAALLRRGWIAAMTDRHPGPWGELDVVIPLAAILHVVLKLAHHHGGHEYPMPYPGPYPQPYPGPHGGHGGYGATS
jgi:hypothetical protein